MTTLPAAPALPVANAFKVLVVEDQKSVRAALVAQLQHAGVPQVLEAGDGDSALERWFAAHAPSP